MHVLVIPSWYPQKDKEVVGSFFKEQVKVLASAGVEVGVIVPQINPVKMGGGGNFRWGTTQDCEDEKVYRFFIPNFFTPFTVVCKYVTSYMANSLFKRYIKENGVPNVIHAHCTSYGGCLAYYISKRYGIPYLITEHASTMVLVKHSRSQLKFMRDVIQGSSFNLAVSKGFSDLLNSKFDPNNRFEYLPNVLPRSFELRADIEMPESTSFKFLHVSLLTKNKGVDVLIRAFAKEFLGQPLVILEIGGDGAEREALERLARSLGVGSQIRFIGMLDRQKVLKRMLGCNAYVLSSHFETFGVVLIEALSLGKPVIATRCCGPESIVNSHNGLLVDEGSVSEMGEALKSIFENYSYYDPDAIRADCINEFGTRIFLKKIVGLYEHVFQIENSISRAVNE